MTGERKVNAAPLCPGEVELFRHPYDAWEHFVKHVLNAAEGEPWGWGILIPALQASLDARRRADLYEQGRQASPERVPGELRMIWPAFLAQIVAAIKLGVSLGWYYEEKPRSDEGPYKVFAPSGILAYLDSERVRTAFLPSKEELAVPVTERAYRLFLTCWDKMQRKYDKALKQGRVINASTNFQELSKAAPTQTVWERLK